MRSKIKHKKIGTKGQKLRIVALVLVLVAIFGLYCFSEFKDLIGSPLDESSQVYKEIEVASGSSTTAIGAILEEEGIISNASKFKIYAKLNRFDGKLKAGVYSLSPSMNMRDIMEIIVSGNSYTKTFTIPEGYTIQQTAKTLADKGFVNADNFLGLTATGTFDYKFMYSLPTGNQRLEGFLFPETYEVFSNASEEDIINKMLTQFDYVFKDEYYDRAKELGYSVHDIITIASLIERETRADSERAKVASVIYNRLEKGQALEIDATVQYALGEQKDRLTYKDLEIESAYNTYLYNGLPVGPICSPGEASIKAALYPEDTDYYYYVLKSKDEVNHNFAKTYDEFLKYKQAYKNSF